MLTGILRVGSEWLFAAINPHRPGFGCRRPVASPVLGPPVKPFAATAFAAPLVTSCPELLERYGAPVAKPGDHAGKPF